MTQSPVCRKQDGPRTEGKHTTVAGAGSGVKPTWRGKREAEARRVLRSTGKAAVIRMATMSG